MSKSKITRESIKEMAEVVRNVLIPNTVNSNGDLIRSVKEVLDIKILFTNNSSIDGYLRWDSIEKVPEIILSRKNNNNINRHIFTVAHELGHLFIHWKWTPGKDIELGSEYGSEILNVYGDTDIVKPMFRGKDYDNQEREADEFAGNLLMPLDKVKIVYDGLFDDDKKDLDIAKYDIASEFGVSPSAAWRRLKNLEDRGKISVG